MSKTMNIKHIVELVNALRKLIVELSLELGECEETKLDYSDVIDAIFDGYSLPSEEGEESRIGYSDVISTIANGDYFSSQKKTLMAMIEDDRNEAYYESVIVILNSDMWLSDKIEAIEYL